MAREEINVGCSERPSMVVQSRAKTIKGRLALLVQKVKQKNRWEQERDYYSKFMTNHRRKEKCDRYNAGEKLKRDNIFNWVSRPNVIQTLRRSYYNSKVKTQDLKPQFQPIQGKRIQSAKSWQRWNLTSNNTKMFWEKPNRKQVKEISRIVQTKLDTWFPSIQSSGRDVPIRFPPPHDGTKENQEYD